MKLKIKKHICDCGNEHEIEDEVEHSPVFEAILDTFERFDSYCTEDDDDRLALATVIEAELLKRNLIK